MQTCAVHAALTRHRTTTLPPCLLPRTVEKYPLAHFLDLHTAVLQQILPADISSSNSLWSTQIKSELERETFRKLILTTATYTADSAFCRAECKHLIDQTFTNIFFFCFSPNFLFFPPKPLSSPQCPHPTEHSPAASPDLQF